MITHLAMNSHPDPKKVLVIGGGDGGVLREVVKHDCVEEATLCDIDEAVIRLSKQYLPTMAVGFQHPKVKVHIGDGFKFLEDYKNTFECVSLKSRLCSLSANVIASVIITDSSDPEGPAESLFQKPYFELLFGALREGGVITTQGCASPLFLHQDHSCKKSRSLVVERGFDPWTEAEDLGYIRCLLKDHVHSPNPHPSRTTTPILFFS